MKHLSSQTGQSTLEYALVVSAFMVLTLACGAMWHLAEKGVLAQLSYKAQSHSLDRRQGLTQAIHGVAEIFLY